MDYVYSVVVLKQIYLIIKESKRMEKLLELLEDIDSDIDFRGCQTLIDDGELDSFAILEIVAEINDTFDVQIGASDIVPENFNSAKAMWAMIQRLQDE